MTPERPHTPADAGPSEHRWPWTIAAIALVAAVAQVLASIVLGMARLQRFTAAANESAYPYMVIAALLAVVALSVWVVRRRLVLALPLAVLMPMGIWLALRTRTSRLGLAYHSEFILHHFSALLCLFLVLSLTVAWARDPRLGKLRIAPALLAIPGALMLAAAHLADVPLGPEALGSRVLATAGATALLAAWPVAAGVFWSSLGPSSRRPLALVLLLPVVIRVGFAGWHGLSGELVGEGAIVWVGAAIITTAFVALSILRPRLELWVMILVGLICLVGSMFFYILYEFRFGELEDDLSGLLQSLFGFVIPYPSYVDDSRSAAMMMGLFFAFVTVYSALVSTEDRVRGVALGLMLIAGIGFSSPHLVLMYGVGALLLIETLLPGAPFRDLDSAASSLAELERQLQAHEDAERAGEAAPGEASETAARLHSVRAIFQGLAERLDLDPPTEVVVGPDQVKLGLRGEVDGSQLDLRAVLDSTSARIELSLGLPGRGEPVFELIPDPGKRGKRPNHLLARSHRVSGELRALEDFGEAPLDALSSFPTAYLRAWYGGVQLDLGRELEGLRVDPLDALVRSLARGQLHPNS